MYCSRTADASARPSRIATSSDCIVITDVSTAPRSTSRTTHIASATKLTGAKPVARRRDSTLDPVAVGFGKSADDFEPLVSSLVTDIGGGGYRVGAQTWKRDAKGART